MNDPPHMRYFNRFPDSYYAKEPVIAYSKRRERIVIFFAVFIAIAITMWFGSY